MYITVNPVRNRVGRPGPAALLAVNAAKNSNLKAHLGDRVELRHLAGDSITFSHRHAPKLLTRVGRASQASLMTSAMRAGRAAASVFVSQRMRPPRKPVQTSSVQVYCEKLSGWWEELVTSWPATLSCAASRCPALGRMTNLLLFTGMSSGTRCALR